MVRANMLYQMLIMTHNEGELPLDRTDRIRVIATSFERNRVHTQMGYVCVASAGGAFASFH